MFPRFLRLQTVHLRYVDCEDGRQARFLRFPSATLGNLRNLRAVRRFPRFSRFPRFLRFQTVHLEKVGCEDGRQARFHLGNRLTARRFLRFRSVALGNLRNLGRAAFEARFI